MDYHFRKAQNSEDFKGIIALQQANLLQNLSLETIQKEGFVRVCHSLEDLTKLNEFEEQLIAIQDNEVIAYILAMPPGSRTSIPMLLPMFEQFDQIDWKGQKISSYSYLAIGQVCVAKEFRSQGLFANAYAAYKELFSKKYDFAITELSKKNLRSLSAHKKIGFQTIHTFQDEYEEWEIVLWDWKNS